MPNYKDFDLDIQKMQKPINYNDPQYTKKFPRSECECHTESKMCERRTLSVCAYNC